MYKLLNKLTFDECAKCKQRTMVRPRTCNETAKVSHSCVTCVPVDDADMDHQRPEEKIHRSKALH